MFKKLIFSWLKGKVVPETLADLNIDHNKPIFYLLNEESLSDRLVVEDLLHQHRLPESTLSTRVVFLRSRKAGLKKRYSSTMSDAMLEAIEQVRVDAKTDVQLVPVSVFWGRAPSKQNSWLSLFFADSWSSVGRAKRLLSAIVHGRHLFIQISKPVAIADILRNAKPELAERKLFRLLRVHFRRVKLAMLGPDLSHRRTFINELLSGKEIQQIIAEESKRKQVAVEKIERKARKYAYEISAHYSPAVVRFFDRVLSWLWNKIYHGVEVHNFDALDEVSKEGVVVYVPCHRSHIDYLLLSYVLYHRGLVAPHIAAGKNLNIPIIGPLFRRGGAFFIRRKFSGDRLYTAIIHKYLSMNLAKGVSLEYFIEGTRSRTGRLLQPKVGMLTMTINSYLKKPDRPVFFIPVYFGYERLFEGQRYIKELRGQAKKKESLLELIRALPAIRADYGRVFVNIGAPIELEALLTEAGGDLLALDNQSAGRKQAMRGLVDNLSLQIMRNINSSAVVTPVNLVALALLSVPRRTMHRQELIGVIDKWVTLLREAPYSDLQVISVVDGKHALEHCQALKLIEVDEQKHTIQVRYSDALMMTYFRNNLLHLIALPSLIACTLLHRDSIKSDDIKRLVRIAYPFAQSELFLPWDDDALDKMLDACISTMHANGMLIKNGVDCVKPVVGSIEAQSLRCIAQPALQMIERYHLTLAVLINYGRRSLTKAKLVTHCVKAAEMLAETYELNAPEFFDRRLFQTFIDLLIEREVVTEVRSGLLDFDQPVIDAEEAAKSVLGAEISHWIHSVVLLSKEP